MNCKALERMLAGSAAVRRELQNFELMQIFNFDPKIEELAQRQKDRMMKEMGTTSIPLHVILDPSGKELARFQYSPIATPADYIKFLAEGLAKFNAH